MDKAVVDFLIRAKKATYAGKGAEAPSSRPASHDLIYKEDDLMYMDTYLGGREFAGEEALWRGGVPFWSMNYAGRVTGDTFSGDFLKQALLRVPEDKPFRGPERYTEGDWEYLCGVNGDADWFAGEETISLKGDVVYECRFHGGRII